MASEVTYAEVKFKNASPTAVIEAPPETKKHEHHPQKYPPWLPWLISLLLLLTCIALVVVLLVAPFSHSSKQPTALQEKFTAWECNSAVSENKGQGWVCCPKGWKRFQNSCYFLSLDKMPWAESEQNCTGMGSHLVVINSREEQVFLSEQIKQGTGRPNFYIGLRAVIKDQWQWVDKTPYNVTAAFWRTGEPSEGDEKCVAIHKDSEIPNNWNNVRCQQHWRICEAAAVTV
ncbi:C-type lectin domain family 4 member A-like [Myiozetetes cayanensis]|uniref:C-type lectin domain family 4 member A-like n=1 Tax=Myiozetetes cayanensis TaxID=478635 RepID=UPI00215F57C0|nr:C-type lectin domain family 4 member A-like [Myiozetetes cayanensis]XP_050187461.1 C-type lectin domain family 4 member A-like [Myiozetetes cayanensis]XP_050187463.1 C-type lectin domain family 4 member A-like [Myiozetetes cayanensis]